MKRNYLHWGWCVLTAVLFLGQACYRENTVYLPEEREETENIVFSIALPSSQMRTRDASDYEASISEVDMLVFEPDNGAFKYTAYPYLLDPDPDPQGRLRYMVKLQKGECDIMLLANSGEYIRSSFPVGISPKTPREQIIKGLQMEMEGKWNITPGSDGYRDMPMWSIRSGVHINQTTNLKGENGFHLTRAFAKVNVEVKLPEAEKNNFQLVDVRFYHYSSKGQLIPNSWEDDATHVKVPSLVDNDKGIKGPLVFDNITDNVKCQDEIYVLEAPAGVPSTHPAYPCIVVGGYYKGQMGYYRIDFANKTENTTTYIPLLRNYSYEITITKVNSPGLPDPETAYESLPVNIEADVVGWEEKIIGDVYFDGHNYLCIDQGRYEFSKEERTQNSLDNRIYITTDYKDGWELDKIEYETGNNWLEFMGGNNGTPGGNPERWLRVSVNETGLPRSATVYITAGRIRGAIEVRQTARNKEAKLELNMYRDGRTPLRDGEWVNYNSDIWDVQSCDFLLEWAPAEAQVEVRVTNPKTGYSQMEFLNEGSVPSPGPITNPEGKYQFDLMLKPFNTDNVKQQGQFSFPKQGIEYEFTVSYNGESITKRFSVTNKLKDLQATKLRVCRQQQFYYIDIKYNADWELIAEGDLEILDDEVLQRIPEEKFNVTGIEDATLKIKLKAGEQHDGKKVTLKFAKHGEPTKIYDQVEIMSIYNYPNSYMVWSGGSVTFNIKKVFRMWESELINEPLEDGILSAKMLWQDTQWLVRDVGFSLDSNDRQMSTITVYGNGDHQGNAVVALFLDDRIVWSWHIWIIDYNPNEWYVWYNNNESIATYLMICNLGVKSPWLGNTDVLGLYYQWGRKDPFPTCARVRTSELPGTLLGNGGNGNIYVDDIAYHVKTAPVTEANNLVTSIEHPYLFYTSSAYPYDWYSSTGGNYNHKLWRTDSQIKSDFDPCPEGWRSGNYYELGSRFFYTWNFVAQGQEDLGWHYTDPQIGAYPKAGYINYDGNYTLVGSECWLWYGINDRGAEPQFGLGDRTFIGSDGTYRRRIGLGKACGLPVRCEKENGLFLQGWDPE